MQRRGSRLRNKDALVANYRFNEISGTTLIDYSGNNLDGINNGALINQTGKID